MLIQILKNKNVKYGLIGLSLLAIGVGAGRFSKPTKVVTEFKEKEVIKYVEKRDEKKNIKITKKKETSKDGSTIETEIVEDNSTSQTNISSNSNKEKELKQEVKNSSGLTLSALALTRDLNFNEAEFGVAVSKRVFSNIAVGVVATEKRTLGLTIGLEF